MNRLSPILTATASRQQLLKEAIDSSLSLLRQSPPIDSGKPLADKIYFGLQHLAPLYSDRWRAEAALRVTSDVLSMHFEAHLPKVRRLQAQKDKIQTQLETLDVADHTLPEFKAKRDGYRAKARLVVQNVRSAYARLAVVALVVLLTLLGEAGLVFMTWINQEEDSLFTLLIAAAQALGFVFMNEFFVRVGFAPLYERVYSFLFPTSPTATALRNKTQPQAGGAPASFKLGSRLISRPSLNLSLMAAMTLLQIAFIYGILQMRKDYVSEATEGAFLFSSTCTILVLSLFTHKLSEAMGGRYSAVKTLGASIPCRDELAEVNTAIKAMNRQLRAIKPLKQQAARLDRDLHRAADQAYQAAYRDPKIAQSVQLMTLQLTAPPVTQPTSSPSPQPVGTTVSATSSAPTVPPTAMGTSGFSPPQHGQATMGNGSSPFHFGSRRSRTSAQASAPSPTHPASGAAGVTSIAQGSPAPPPLPTGGKPMTSPNHAPVSKGTTPFIITILALSLMCSGSGCRRAPAPSPRLESAGASGWLRGGNPAPTPLVTCIYRDKTATEQHSPLISPADMEAARMVREQLTAAIKTHRDIWVDVYTTPKAGRALGDSRHHLALPARKLTPRETNRQLDAHQVQLTSLLHDIEQEDPVQGESAILANVAALIRRMSEQRIAPNAERQLIVVSDLEEYSSALTAAQIAGASSEQFQKLLTTVQSMYPPVEHPPHRIVFIVVPNSLQRTEAYQSRLREFWKKVATEWGVQETVFISPQSQTVYQANPSLSPAEHSPAPGLQEQTQAERTPSLTLDNDTTGDIVLNATDVQSQQRYQFTFPAKTKQMRTLPIGTFAWTLRYERFDSKDTGRCRFKAYRHYTLSITLVKGHSDSPPITLGDPE